MASKYICMGLAFVGTTLPAFTGLLGPPRHDKQQLFQIPMPGVRRKNL